MGRPWVRPTLMCVGGLPLRGRPRKKPLSNHRRPASWEPDMESSHKATWSKPLGKPPRSFGWGVPAWYFLFPFCSLFSLHMTLTNPVHPRALSDAGLGLMRRALFRSSRYSGNSQNFGVRSSWVSLSKRILDSWLSILRMSHAIVSERYSAKIQVRCMAVCRTFLLCASGYWLVARIWKQYPSKSLSICLLRPSSGIVRRASGQVLGRCTISCSFSYPSTKRTPAASSLVLPLEYIVWGQCSRGHLPGPATPRRQCRTDPGQRQLMRLPYPYIPSLWRSYLTPDHPLSVSEPPSDTLSSFATMSWSTSRFAEDAFLSIGIRRGVSENVFLCIFSR